MSWIALALLAPFFWAVSNFVDKYCLERYTKTVSDFLVFTSLTNWIAVPILLWYFGVPAVSPAALIPLATGALLLYSYGLYAKALQLGETSQLVILFKLGPIFTLTFAFLFLGQMISGKEFLAFLLLLAGTLFVSIERNKGRLFFIKGFGWILGAILMWSMIYIIADYALSFMSFGEFMVYDTIGSTIGILPLLLSSRVRREAYAGFKNAVPAKYGWYTLNNLLDMFAQLSMKKALSLAPSAGLVSAITQVQSFYAIAFGVVLTLFLPQFFRENISPRAVGIKIIGAVVMFSGVWLLL